MPDACPICDHLTACRNGASPRFIFEFPHSVLVVGDHQYHRGYCVLLLKQHAREPHDLPPDVQQAMFAELMLCGRALMAAFEPWKMNYSCYGNQVPHVHWHLFPRYESDPDRFQTPWANAAKFAQHPTDPDTALAVAARLRPALERQAP